VTDLISGLVSLGLTVNEATLYRILSIHGDMTGYECAKLTGISRSNVYPALAGLFEKGGAFIVDGAAQKYSPAPIREFCANQKRAFETSVNYVLEHMPSPAAPSGAYITVTGASAILDKMKNMIAACTERLYISAEPAVISKIAAELAYVIKNERKVVLMTDRGTDLITGCDPNPMTENEDGLSGAIVYNMTRKDGQIRLIVDSLFVLTGDFAENRPCSCLFSSSDTLVSLFKDAMKNEIRLIELGEMK